MKRLHLAFVIGAVALPNQASGQTFCLDDAQLTDMAIFSIYTEFPVTVAVCGHNHPLLSARAYGLTIEIPAALHELTENADGRAFRVFEAVMPGHGSAALASSRRSVIAGATRRAELLSEERCDLALTTIEQFLDADAALRESSMQTLMTSSFAEMRAAFPPC
jgi:hypothetical protein